MLRSGMRSAQSFKTRRSARFTCPAGSFKTGAPGVLPALVRRSEMKLLKMMNPIAVTRGAFTLAGSAVNLVDHVARETAHVVLSGGHWIVTPGEQEGETAQRDAGTVVDTAPGPTTPGARHAAGNAVEGAPRGPTTVPVELHAP